MKKKELTFDGVCGYNYSTFELSNDTTIIMCVASSGVGGGYYTHEGEKPQNTRLRYLDCRESTPEEIELYLENEK